MTTTESQFRRRNRLEMFTDAERAIYDASGVVEAAGTHPLLTDAVVLLGQAREKVADFVDLPTATRPTPADPRAAEGEPKRLSEGDMTEIHAKDAAVLARYGYRLTDAQQDRGKLLEHVAALDAEIAGLQQQLAAVRSDCISERNWSLKVFDELNRWGANEFGLQSTGDGHSFDKITAIAAKVRKQRELLAEVQQANVTLQQQLAEANNPEAVEELGSKAILHKSHYEAILGRAKRAEQEIANYATYGQGGATFQEAQWIERLAQAEQTRDVKIEELEKRLAALAEVKDGEALESLAQMAMDEYNKRILTEDCLESWGAAINVVIAHVRAQCEARHEADLAAANERIAGLEQRAESAEKDRDQWKASFNAQNSELRRLSDEMADHEDAIEHLRAAGKAVGCDHVGSPDERATTVRCIEHVVEGLELQRDRVEAEHKELKTAMTAAGLVAVYLGKELKIVNPNEGKHETQATHSKGTPEASVGRTEAVMETAEAKGECPDCHYTTWVISAETGKVLYCKVCDEIAQKRDALQMERELKAENSRLAAELAAAKKQLAECEADARRLAQLHADLEKTYCDAHLDSPPKVCPACELSALRQRYDRLVAACGPLREACVKAKVYLRSLVLTHITRCEDDGPPATVLDDISAALDSWDQAALSPHPEQPAPAGVEAKQEGEHPADWAMASYDCPPENAAFIERLLNEPAAPSAVPIRRLPTKPEHPAFVCPKCKRSTIELTDGPTVIHQENCEWLLEKQRMHVWEGSDAEVQAAQAKAAKPEADKKPSSLRQLVAAMGFSNFDCPKCKGQYFKTVNPDWQTTGQRQRIRCSGHFIKELNEYTGCSWEGTFDDMKAAKPDAPGDGEKVQQPVAVEQTGQEVGADFEKAADIEATCPVVAGAAEAGEPEVWYLVGESGDDGFYATNVWEDQSVAEDCIEETDRTILEVVPMSALDASERRYNEQVQDKSRIATEYEAQAKALRTRLEAAEAKLAESERDRLAYRETIDCLVSEGGQSKAGKSVAERLAKMERFAGEVRAESCQDGTWSLQKIGRIRQALQRLDQPQSTEAK